MQKKKGTIAILVLITVIGIAASHAPINSAKNLKVLPANISDQRLDSIMQSYNKALGVSCDFCHVKSKMWGQTDKLDYAADGEPMKENARDMMRMTIEINSKHFYHDKNKESYMLNTVTCITCHRGEPFPEAH